MSPWAPLNQRLRKSPAKLRGVGVTTGVTLSENACGVAPAFVESAAMTPIPSLHDLARHGEAEWFWANCPLPYCHAGALPWAAIIAKLGPHVSNDRLRPALRCTVCGHRGGNISIVSRSRYDLPPQPIPIACVPALVAASLLAILAAR